jgi:RNA ligase (TIGR02306 family)
MRKLVTKRIIDRISPIENADAIETAHIGGWQVVVKKGEMKSGDTAVYFEIDSALPVEDERYSFLKDRCLKRFTANSGETVDECIRVKTIKLRGCLSQGLLLPVIQFPDLSAIPMEEDCSDLLRVRHYDELSGMYSGNATAGNQKGSFPYFIPKTDEERIQNLPAYFTTMKDVKFEVSEKVDGSSMSVFYAPVLRPESPFGVCSRNFELKLDDKASDFVEVAKVYGLERVLARSFVLYGQELALQGELNGPGVNGNRDKNTALSFKVFRIFDITKQEFLTPQQRIEWCMAFGVPHVNVVQRNFKPFTHFNDMDELLKFSDGLTANGNPREGLVYKQEDAQHPITFKAVSNAYLMKEK